MSKYIPDISSRRWVIVSSSRVTRPHITEDQKSQKCPLCPGHEAMTAGEVLRYGEGEPNKPGWTLRVIPNKFPITDFHEVIIHSPDDKQDIAELPLSQVELIIRSYKSRFNYYQKNGQVIIFCNHGEHAGASLSHPHSQLVVIPTQINLDALVKEPFNNMVDETKYFNVYCPDFSQWPYEVWIAPKKEGTHFGQIEDNEIADFSVILQQVLKKLYQIYKEKKFNQTPFGYNFYIYPKTNWYLRITPRFIHRAGFELGTGLSVNIIDPAEAALDFKGIDHQIKNVLEKLKKHTLRTSH